MKYTYEVFKWQERTFIQEFENDATGALLKSDEIKNDLFIFEHYLWQYQEAFTSKILKNPGLVRDFFCLFLFNIRSAIVLV